MNNFPIDTAGIGDALQRSAASFRAANTDLNEAIALVTATNAVIQDPSRVGNMWKTVSARIRGADTELEEMGEDTEDLIKSTSELRDLIKSMTGFDIMEDEDTFKSIKDIVVGIGKEWDNLTDINQASLLEKLAGKTQSNALAAALSNWQMIEDAYETASNSAGSAMEEQQRYQESMQYSLDQFAASVESLAHTLMDSGVLKWFIDLGTTGVSALDAVIQKFSAIPIVLGGVGIGAFIKNFDQLNKSCVKIA